MVEKWPDKRRKVGKERLNARKAATAAAAIVVLMWASSCSNAQKDYEEWVTTEQIAKNEANIKSLKDSYEFYYKDIQARQKKLVALEAAGDLRGAKAERERIKSLIETLKDTEKAIDKAQNKRVDLDKYNQDWKIASETDAAWGVGGIMIPPHRTFIEAN